MSHTPKSPIDLTPEDITYLRYLAIVWGVLIAAVWFVLDEVRAQLVMTGVAITSMIASLLAMYLYRRLRRRK